MNHFNYKTLSLFISSMLITGTVLADKSIDQDICLTANTAPLPGAYQANYHLHLTKINSKATPKLFAINALETAIKSSTNPAQTYENALVGTGSVIETTEMLDKTNTLQIALTGATSSKNGAIEGLWRLNYHLELNPTTYNGSLIGIIDFTPIVKGLSYTPITPSYTETKNIQLVRINCLSSNH